MDHGMQDNGNIQIKKWSHNPNSEKYHSRSAAYKAKYKPGRNSKESFHGE